MAARHELDCIIKPTMGELKYVCVGELEGWSSTSVPSWALDGSFDCIERQQDLVAEWVEPKRIKGWVNIYLSKLPGGYECGSFYRTKEEANHWKSYKGGERVACLPVDVLEGQGLDGSAS